MDKARIERKLKGMEEYASRVNDILPKEFRLYAKLDPNLKLAVERCVQLISDKELDLLAQLYNELNLGFVGDSESLINKFEGRLNKELLKSMIETRKLRNLLVHEYSIGQYDEQTFKTAKRASMDIELLKKEVIKLIPK